MSIQTACLEFIQGELGNVIRVRTPDGTAEWPIGAFIPAGQIYTQYAPNPEAKPKAISKKAQKRASIRQENEISEALGGKRQAGSGSVAHLKGDVRVRHKYRVEAKYTRSGSYRVTRTELSKIRGECEGTEIPVFVIDFVDPQTGGSADRWAMVEFDEFQKLERKVPNAAPNNR